MRFGAATAHRVRVDQRAAGPSSLQTDKILRGTKKPKPTTTQLSTPQRSSSMTQAAGSVIGHLGSMESNNTLSNYLEARPIAEEDSGGKGGPNPRFSG